MTDWSRPPPGQPRHKASRGARGAAARLAAPLTAVVVVVGVIALLIWINGRSGGGGSGSSVVTAPTTHSSAAGPTPSPSGSHRTTPTPTPSRTHHTPAPHRTHHPQHSASPPAPPPVDDAFAPVEVLNNSRIQGLAHHVAAEVEGAGWAVSQVGNLRGRVAETTVYYPDGEFDAAAHLARDFGQIMRIEPQSEAGLSSGSLVLVVTRYWTG